MGKKADRIRELETEVADLKCSNENLEAWRQTWLSLSTSEKDEVSLQIVTGALHDLWKVLGATHQTEAMGTAHKLVHFRNTKEPTMLETAQQLAGMKNQLEIVNLALRQSRFEADNAKRDYDTKSFELGNCQARVAELEEFLKELQTALADGIVIDGGKTIFDRISAMIGEDGE